MSNELDRMFNEVLGDDTLDVLDRRVELEWCQSQLKIAKVVGVQLRAAFRMYYSFKDEPNMRTVYSEYFKHLQMMNYLENRLHQLESR